MLGRIKEVREKRHLTQEIVSYELGITQQTLSRYEKDISTIKIDILKKLTEYFNVTADYLLGISEVKRGLEGQMRVNKELDECFELIEVFLSLDQEDKDLMWTILVELKKRSVKRELLICKREI